MLKTLVQQVECCDMQELVDKLNGDGYHVITTYVSRYDEYTHPNGFVVQEASHITVIAEKNETPMLRDDDGVYGD